jgi:hypothetical protein
MGHIRKHTRDQGTRVQTITSPGFSVGPPDLTAVGQLLRHIEVVLS